MTAGNSGVALVKVTPQDRVGVLSEGDAGDHMHEASYECPDT